MRSDGVDDGTTTEGQHEKGNIGTMIRDVTLAFQDYYPDDVAHCFGCGRLNEQGHQLKTYWDGDETVTRYRPRPYHTAIPGYVYGGLVASLIDCHGTGTAAAAAARLEGVALDGTVAPAGQAPRFVTAALTVQYLRPTPLGPELEIRGVVKEAKARKVIVEATLSADGEITARGEVVAVRMPEHLRPAENAGGEKTS